MCCLQIKNILKQMFNVTDNGPYHDEINQFLNKQFYKEYNLSLETVSLYCDSFREPKEKGK